MCQTIEQSEKLIKEHRRGSDRRLADVPPEHVRIVLLWFAEVFERTLQQAFNLDELTSSEIGIPNEPDGSEELVH